MPRTKRQQLKACRKCKAILSADDVKCPYCGSTDLTDDWDGMVIVISEESEVLKLVEGIDKPGKYAIQIR